MDPLLNDATFFKSVMLGIKPYSYVQSNPAKYIDLKGLHEITGGGYGFEAHFIGGFGASINICCDGKNRPDSF